MKRTILYPHLLACLSLLFLGTGCEREEIISERIALNVLEVQLGVVTRASSDGDDPTLTAPNSRRNWVLEVQIEGSQAEDYVFSEQDEVWIPKSNPVYFPAGVNNDGCNVTFTLRPPTSSNATTGQDGSAAGLLEADILKNTIKMKPQGNYLISLAHTNSLIEIAFEHSLENRVIEIALHGNKIHPYSIDNKNYLCIVPGGSNNIILTTKEAEAKRQYALDIDFEIKPNTRYVFTVTTHSDMVIHSPIVSPWSDTIGDNAILEGAKATPSAKEFIHIEGYTGDISLMVSDTLVQLHPYPNSKEKGESIYYFSLDDVLKNKAIDSLLLEEHSKNILIGRNTSDINLINLKVDSNGKLLLRKAQDGSILINTVSEILLVNMDLGSNYKQEADIDLSCISKRSWEPIGNFESPFEGTYDGNGYAIHHLNTDIKEITSWNQDNLEEGELSTLDPVGFLVDYHWMLPARAVGLFGVNKGTINNVYASGTMSISEIIRKDKKGIAFGGICGYNDGGSITYCTNNIELSVHTILKGEGSSYDVFAVGGICGTSRGGGIEYSINYGDIITEKSVFRRLFIGGICGSLYSRYDTDKIKINSCINHGNILFNDLVSDVSRENFAFTFGGISGVMYGHNSKSREPIQHLSNCYNTGNIIARETEETHGKFSGIVGTMIFPYSTQAWRISSCYSIGEIKLNLNINNYPQIAFDPIICFIYEYCGLPSSLELPLVENCFYDVKKAKSNITLRYINRESMEFTKNEVLEYEKIVDEKILESISEFSLDSWPTPDLWDTNAWRDLGSWDGDNPIYPKLRFEKDFRFYP